MKGTTINSPSQAIAYEQTYPHFGVGQCLRNVVTAYDVFISPGPNTAAQAYQQTALRGSGLPLSGALLWWTGGRKGAGHVAIADGEGGCYSTDFNDSGYVGDGNIHHLTDARNIDRHDPLLSYKGWSRDLNGFEVIPKPEVRMILVKKQGVSTVYRFDVNHLQQVSDHQVKDALRLGAVIKELPASDSIWSLPFDR